MKDYYIEYCLSKGFYAKTCIECMVFIESTKDYKAYKRRMIVKDRLVAILRAIGEIK